MASDELMEFVGKIEEILPNNLFRVKVSDHMTLICYANGKLRKHKIRMVAGDDVKIEVSVYDLSKGRITYRL